MSLAIVIPAFKSQYLEVMLTSVANQTDKNFKVYIGDDNSPYNLYEIVSRFTDKLEIVYKKFDNNLGSISLTQHWDRCIEMTETEEWIWLFSDDDLMDENCVSKFKDALFSTKSGYDLYRFNTKIIDYSGKLLHDNALLPQVESSLEFAINKLTVRRNSYVVEYIFSKAEYLKTGKFIDFPLAWSSDEATWINIGTAKGIFTIDNAYIYWRYSFINISSLTNLVDEKIEATVQYLVWLRKWFILYAQKV